MTRPGRKKNAYNNYRFSHVFFYDRAVGRFSGSETPQEIVDLGLTFRRKLRKRDYLLVIARLACSTDSACVIFFGFTRPPGRPAVPSKSGNATMDLMTVPKLPKHVSKSVPNPVVGGGT